MKILLTLILGLTLSFPALTALAQTVEKTQAQIDAENSEYSIHIANPYTFATMPGATSGAAFMRIENNGKHDDALIGAYVDFAKYTEIHENFIDPDFDTMMMRKIKGIRINAGEEALLKPKGYHVMFIKMEDPLVMDTEIRLLLQFAKSGIYQVRVPVVTPGIVPRENVEVEKKSAEEKHLEWPPRYDGADEDLIEPVYKRIQ